MSKELENARYIYIDDVKDATVDAIISGLKDTGLIDIEYERVTDFSSMITYFERELSNFDGILLDLRLDGSSDLNVKYTATGLAQELRNRSAAGEGIKDVPIVLCSTDRKISYYENDSTSHDLFDYKFVKESGIEHKLLAKKLNSLAKGFLFIIEAERDLSRVLGRDISKIDSRILGKFIDSDSNAPIHEYAQYFLQEVIRKPGPLIHSKLFAARLGIDIEGSSDWEKLLTDYFLETKYEGVFSDAWNRWWMNLINEKFKSITGNRLATLNAEERVNALKEATGLKELNPAKPIDKSVSTNYWTICEYFERPLDPLEGFKIYNSTEPKPWQDQKYLSFEAAAERYGISKGLKIHPEENERLDLAKQTRREAK